MYRPSNSQHLQWTSRSSPSSAPSYPTASPGPMPAAPQMRTVSLPHPNSTPYYASSADHSSFQGPSNIVSLNPLLSWSGVPPLCYSVTSDVQSIRLLQGCPPNLLQAPAVHPACTFLVLSVPSLPLWSQIEVRNNNGVSAYDVLARIRDVLNRSVSPVDMNAMVSISDVTSEYFRARTRAHPREFAQGVKRIDFLGPNVFFAGLSRSRDGQDRWEVHFVPRA